MNTMITLVSLSISGSLLALALFVLKPMLRHRVSKTFLYYIWALVLMRLVLPVGAPVNAMEALFGGTISNAAVHDAAAMEGGDAITPEVNYSMAEGTANIYPDGAKSSPQTQTEESVSGQNTQTAQSAFDAWAFAEGCLSLVWAAGTFLSLAWCAISYMRFCRRIKKTSVYALPTDLDVFRSLRGGRRVKLAYNGFITTPMLIGVFSPVIVIPRHAYVKSGMRLELESILRHELTHYRRKDLLFKWLVAAVTSLHWFNPLMIPIRREIARACELSCDEAVIKNMSGDEKQIYGDTLMALSAGKTLPAGILATTLCEKRSELKERLISIMKYRKKTAWAAALSLALALMLAGCAVALGAANGGGNNIPAIADPLEDGQAISVISVPETPEPRLIDFDGDGLEDTITTEQKNSGMENAYVIMKVTLGSGRELHEVSLGGEMGDSEPVICDFSGDGRDDILLCLKETDSSIGAVYPYLSRVDDNALSPMSYIGDFIKNNSISYPQPESFINEYMHCMDASVVTAGGRNLLRFEFLDTEAGEEDATLYYIDASWNGEGWYIENMGLGVGAGGKLTGQSQPKQPPADLRMIPAKHRAGFEEAQVTLVEPAAVPTAVREPGADFDPTMVNTPGTLTIETAQNALRQLYDMTGVQVKKCYATGDAAKVLLSMDGRDFNLASFCTASFDADGNCRSLTITYKQEGVDYSPVDPADVIKPEGFASMSKADIARWYYENSAFGDRRGVVSVESDYPYDEIVSLMLGNGDFYEVSFDEASGLPYMYTGPVHVTR